MPASERFTRSTWSAWSSIDRLRCSTPMPPCAGHRDRHPRLGDRVHRAGDQRDRAGVTLRVSRVVVSTSLGHRRRTRPGSSSTSSKVSPSGNAYGARAPAVRRSGLRRCPSKIDGGESFTPYPSAGAGSPPADEPRAGRRDGARYGLRWRRAGRADRPVQRRPRRPVRGPRRPGDDAELDPLTEAERQDVLEDLADLEIYQALLTPDRASAGWSSSARTATSRTTSTGTCCAATCGTCSTPAARGCTSRPTTRPGPLRDLGVRPRLRRRRPRHARRRHRRRRAG